MNLLNEKFLSENIDSIAEYDVSNHKIFGSAYYVYQKGHLAFEKCYGTVGLNSDVPITNTTVFRLASMTKPITSVAALILIERGLLSLDDPIDKYLPAFKNIRIMDASGTDLGAPKKIPTIKNILTHTSGIGSNDTKLKNMTTSDQITIDATLNFLMRVGLDFEPGSMTRYSGMGSFDVLTKIIEIVSGMDYLSFLKKEIFDPCNMVDTTFEPNADQYERLVKMHTRIDSENAEYDMPEGCIFRNFPSRHYVGGAGLVSTLRDYCIFSEMLLNKGVVNGHSLLKEETFMQLCTPQASRDATKSWGLGVRVITAPSYPYLPVSSFGWSGAYGSHFWIDPVNQIYAVFMKNSMVDGGEGNQSACKFEKAVHSSFDI